MRAMLFLALLVLITPPASSQEFLVWVTSDFSSGGMARQDAGACETTVLSLPVSGDAVVRSQDGYIFVINRLGYDNITVLTANDLETPLIQFSTGNRSNPQDILLIDHHKAYVTLFEMSGLLIVDPLTGEHLGSIDLSSVADSSDGIPEMTDLIRWGDKVLVVCQRLDRNTAMMDPAGPGCMAIIDPATDTIVDADPSTGALDPIWLPLENPTSWAWNGSCLLVGCTANWSSYTDGGLVLLDLAGGEEPEVLVTEDELGGNLTHVAAFEDRVFLIISDETWVNSIRAFDLPTATISEPFPGPSGGYLPYALVHDSIFYVADQGTWENPELAGLLLFDATVDTLICGPVATGLPPTNGAVVAPLGADQGPVLAEERILYMVWPNPAADVVHVRPISPRESSLFMELSDLAGRKISSALLSEFGGSLGLIGPQGKPLASGVYLLKVRETGRVETHVVVVNR